jgi:OFA family oxalate/formate antiporter-like MFS transporter
MAKTKNRWLIALSTMGIHVSIGSVYAYSVFKIPLYRELGWTDAQTSWAFSVAILVLGLSAAFLGPWVERIGARISGQIAAVLYAGGLLIAGMAVMSHQLWLFYLGYGVVAGMGLGLGYIGPVSTLVKWFPDRRGLATGLAVMGFGFGSLFASRILVLLFEHYGVAVTCMAAAGAYFVVMVVSARYLAPPPADWRPQCMVDGVSYKRASAPDPVQLTSFEALRTRRFYILWLMLFINIMCGIALISSASPMSQEFVTLTPASAATMVGFMGLFNGLGRIGWASLSDSIGRSTTFGVFCVLQLVLFWILPSLTSPLLFQIAVCLIISCYGGGFALMPAYIADVFGTKQLSAVLGKLLTAWAVAGIVGPMLSALVYEQTHSYATSLYWFGGMFIVALILTLLMARESRRLRQRSIV